MNKDNSILKLLSYLYSLKNGDKKYKITKLFLISTIKSNHLN